MLLRLAILGALVILPQRVLAHGIGQRIDLPIPLDIYLGAAAIVIVASFLLIGFLGKRERSYESYPSYDLYSIRWIRRVAESTSFKWGVKALAVALFAVLLYAGLWGDQTPTQNLLPIFVWVGFTVAFTYVVAFIGNLWPLVNPWKTLHELVDRRERFNVFSWRYGVWPAFVLFFIFRWLENVYPHATEPRALVLVIIGYSIITWTGMTLFGRGAWLKGGDPFTVFFRFIAHFAIIEREERDGKRGLRVRLPAVGILKTKEVLISEIAFVLLALTSVSFDGISSTAFAAGILNGMRDVGMSLVMAKTSLFVFVFLVFALVYSVFSLLIRNYAGHDVSVREVAQRFVLSLLPIAIVYEVVHFTTLLLTEGQRIFILASNPFGYGWNLFGTAIHSVNYGFINFKLLWNIEIGLILFGHVASIYLAHMVAVAYFKDLKTAFKSQIPMLVLMVAYTVMGLWILAQPPVLVN